jgi:nucleotidyltransferase/DNA polymerase involved in DNA repair
MSTARFKYFDDLSGDCSDGCSSGDESDICEDDDERGIGIDDSSLVEEDFRAIVHADVDCFYCQCEILDRGIDPDRPLAIGQKHIVVTCNYAARALGVTKLMGRLDAQLKCPSLLIVDGSDLERYRVHGRKIYESFRRAFQTLRPGCSVCKGSMDEMMADVTAPIPCPFNVKRPTMDTLHLEGVYVYDDQDPQSDRITFTEDQTGATTKFSCEAFSAANRTPTRKSTHAVTPAMTMLLETVSLALQVRKIVLKETGFTTTMGVSYNPLLAKLASGLRKPGTANVLAPRPSIRRLVGSMPLRKIPGIGSRTMKILTPCLVKRFGSSPDQSSPWTCRYVTVVPVCGTNLRAVFTSYCMFLQFWAGIYCKFPVAILSIVLKQSRPVKNQGTRVCTARAASSALETN